MSESVTHCPLCDGSLKLCRDRTYQFKFRGEVHLLQGLERLVCDSCGIGMSSNELAVRNQMAIREFQRSIAGEMCPADILELREKYRMSQEQAARVFKTARRAFSKWERGEIGPTAPTALLLRMAFDHPEFMRALAEKAKEVVDLPARQVMVPQAVVLAMNDRHKAREREAYVAGRKDGARQRITVVIKPSEESWGKSMAFEVPDVKDEFPMELLWQEKSQRQMSLQN